MKDENKKPAVEKEKKKICPFNKDLACEDCRLYIHYTDGRQERVCAFIRVAD